MKFFKSRLFFALCAFILAAIICFVIIPLSTRNQIEVANVAVLTQDVSVGTTITSSMVAEKQMGIYGLPDEIIFNKSELIGKVAIKPLSKNHFACASDVVSEEDFRKDYGIESMLTEDVQLVSILVKSLSASVAGQIGPGSIVDVIYTHTEDVVNSDTYQSSEKASVVRPKELKGLVVYSVFNSELRANTSTSEDKAFVPAVVTFIATKEQADKLVALEYSDSDHLHILLNQ